LVVGVVKNFNVANGATLQVCRAQSGDVDVTLPSNLTGVGAEVSFTAHCQPNTAGASTNPDARPNSDAGANPPAKNLVGCFRL
jgi:hypothetical protein